MRTCSSLKKMKNFSVLEMKLLNDRMDYIDYCANDSVFILNKTYYDHPRDEPISISNAIILVLDSFHTEVTQDELNYALWYQQQQPILNEINLETLCNMDQITKDDFINYYLGTIKATGYGDKVLLKCLEIDCDENSRLYPQEFLKVIDNKYLFRYLKEFV